MTDTLTLPPDEHAVRVALESAAFRSGVDDGRWRLVSLDWPIGMFAVSAAPRDNSPMEYALRIDLAGYPQQAPTAEPWNLDHDRRLADSERPKGERAAKVFRVDWEQGRALYAPWDRVALGGHPNWLSEHPAYVWHSGRDVVFLLRCVHDLLNDDEYLGV